MAEKDLTKKKQAPLIRITKRAQANKWFSIGIYVGAIVIALLIGAVLIASVKVDPFAFYQKMLTIGTIGNKFAYKNIENFIASFVPLLLTSLGLSLSFKMRFWNIGGEGQFIIGAITSAALAIAIDDALSPILMIIVMALGGGIAAGIYGLFTAVLKVKFGTNETLMTLMFNYIALYLLKYFQTRHGTDFFLNPNSARPIFNLLPDNSWMITIGGIGKFSLNISLIFALVFTVFIYIYLNKTKHGYEICVVGDSKRTAQYAGMNVSKVILRTMFFSAFIIGMASAFHVSTTHTLSESITNDVGWTGIVVAWLARLNPIGVVIASLLISILQFGCVQACATYSAVDSNVADLLQGIILFIVLASDFFIRYKVNIDLSYFRRRKEQKAAPAFAEATAVSEPTSDVTSDNEVQAVICDANAESSDVTAAAVEEIKTEVFEQPEKSETVITADLPHSDTESEANAPVAEEEKQDSDVIESNEKTDDSEKSEAEKSDTLKKTAKKTSTAKKTVPAKKENVAKPKQTTKKVSGSSAKAKTGGAKKAVKTAKEDK